MWIGLFSESEEPDLDSIIGFVGEPIQVGYELTKCLDAYIEDDQARKVIAELGSCILDEQEGVWDILTEDLDRLRVSFRRATTFTAPEGG